MKVQTEALATYEVVSRTQAPAYTRPQIVAQALSVIESELRKGVDMLTSPQAVRDYLSLFNARHEDTARERFSVMWLDAQNALICIDELFVGTLTQTSVYPREVVRTAMVRNAAGCILTHNHPSGEAQASRADENLTQTLKSALALVDVRVLDHVITAGSASFSMAEKGLC